MDKKVRNIIIQIAAFVVPAIIAYGDYWYAETIDRIFYAIPVGVAFLGPVSKILKCLEEDYRANTELDVKVKDLIFIFSSTILFFWMYSFCQTVTKEPYSRLVYAWTALFITIILESLVGSIVSFIIKVLKK